VYWVIFIIEQNLVAIDAVMLMMCEYMTSSTNWKYTMYHNDVTGGPSHGQRQYA